MITKAIILLSKIGFTKRILKILAWVFLGLFLLFMVIIFTIAGQMMEAVNEFGNKEIERQEMLSEHNIAGGTVQNPRSNYADNEVPKEFKELYENIADKYSIDWEVLAAIHRVETAFSSNNTKSSAGAIGHTQFMKCTWIGWGYPGCQGGLGNADVPEDEYTDPEKIKKYGGEGVDGNGNGKADPNEISDALSATAEKLYNDGVNDDIEKAIFNYNRSDDYVADVLKHHDEYKNNASFITAGIDDLENLGKGATGKGKVVGDMALPLSKDQFLNNMTGGIGSYDGHPGYDFPVPIGTPVYSIVDGTVVETDSGNPDYPPGRNLAQVLSSNDLGNFVRIKPDDSPELMVNYMHFTKNDGVLVKEGDKVKKGQQIGRSGNSGKSTSAHVHIDVLKNNEYTIEAAVPWYEDLVKQLENSSDKETADK